MIPPRVSERILIDPAPHPALGSPCWIWTGRVNRNGYGRAWNGEREPVVHRLVYEATIGAVPAGMVLDHLCRNRACCNPAHVEPVTVRVNTLRGGAVLFRRQWERIAA